MKAAMAVEAQPGDCSVCVSLSLRATRLARVVFPVGFVSNEDDLEHQPEQCQLVNLSQGFRKSQSYIVWMWEFLYTALARIMSKRQY